jgi:predicted nuclease of restriction endonuclease-like RecB superfamily
VLPSALLITGFSRGKITPRYATLDEATLTLAVKLTDAIKENIGERKEKLLGALYRIENENKHDFRLIRGLSTLLMRRCYFEVQSQINPEQARRTVFKLATASGLATTREIRTDIIQRAANELSVPVEDLEKSLWSDFDENLVLKEFSPLDSWTLIRYYNFALTQTMLFKAVNVEFTVRGANFHKIFRNIKRLGLMYMAEDAGGGSYRISIEGPLSVLKMTEKYGASMAKLIPVILESDYWMIRANVLRRREGFPRVYGFEIHSREVEDRIETLQEPKSDTEQFDSNVEERFWKDFLAVDSGWTIKREPEPLITSSGAVMIPDFSFEKQGAKIYLEIVGFWTKQYLEKKIQKIRQLKQPNIIVAVDRKLGASRKLSDLPVDVILFDKTVPVKPILDRLKTTEANILSSQLDKLKTSQLALRGDIINLGDLSLQVGVSSEAVVQYLEKNPPTDYVVVGSQAVSTKLLREVRAELETLGEAIPFQKASESIEKFGILGSQRLLNLLGYEIEWHGIEPAKAVAIRKNKK